MEKKKKKKKKRALDLTSTEIPSRALSPASLLTSFRSSHYVLTCSGMYDDVNLIQNSNDCNLAHLIAAETFLHQRTCAPTSFKGFASRPIAMFSL